MLTEAVREFPLFVCRSDLDVQPDRRTNPHDRCDRNNDCTCSTRGTSTLVVSPQRESRRSRRAAHVRGHSTSHAGRKRVQASIKIPSECSWYSIISRWAVSGHVTSLYAMPERTADRRPARCRATPARDHRFAQVVREIGPPDRGDSRRSAAASVAAPPGLEGRAPGPISSRLHGRGDPRPRKPSGAPWPPSGALIVDLSIDGNDEVVGSVRSCCAVGPPTRSRCAARGRRAPVSGHAA